MAGVGLRRTAGQAPVPAVHRRRDRRQLRRARCSSGPVRPRARHARRCSSSRPSCSRWSDCSSWPSRGRRRSGCRRGGAARSIVARPARGLRFGRRLTADAPRRHRLRAAGDPRVLGHVPVPASRLGDVHDRGRPRDRPRPPLGGRDGHLVRRVAAGRQPGLRPVRRRRRRAASCRSSTSAGSGSGSSRSRSDRGRCFRFTQQTTQRGLSNAAWSAFYNVVPSERRAQVLAFNDGVPGQIGTILSGLLLLAAGSVLGAATRSSGWAPSRRSRARSSSSASGGDTARACSDACGPGLGEQVLEGGPGWRALTRDPAIAVALIQALGAPEPGVRRMAASLLGGTESPDAAGQRSPASSPIPIRASASPRSMRSRAGRRCRGRAMPSVARLSDAGSGASGRPRCGR